MAISPIEGYLGAVAGSPLTNLSQQLEVLGASATIGFLITGKGVASVYSDRVNISDILTEEGLRLLDLLEEVQGCSTVITNLLGGLIVEVDVTMLAVFKEAFLQSEVYADFINATTNGGRRIGEPLLVMQGTANNTVPAVVTTTAVNRTREQFPGSELEYLVVEGIDHIPTMYGTQRMWLQWVADRFAGKAVKKGCQRMLYGSGGAPRPLEAYQGDLNFFLEYANQPYQA